MSTAVDTAFEELVAASDDAGEPMHGMCILCHPPGQPIPPGAVALCGWVNPDEDGSYASDWGGRPKCGKCLTVRIWPCGHCR